MTVYDIFTYNNYSFITIPLLLLLYTKSYLNNLKFSFIKYILNELLTFVSVWIDAHKKEGLIKSIAMLYLYIFYIIKDILYNYYKPLFNIIHTIFIFSSVFTILQFMDDNINETTLTIIIKYIAIIYIFVLLFNLIIIIFEFFFYNKRMENSNPMLYKVINLIFIFILFIILVILIYLI